MTFFYCVAFSAVAVTTQVAISKGEPLFQVNYTDNYDVSDEEEELVDDEDHVSDDDGEEEGEGTIVTMTTLMSILLLRCRTMHH